jgi:hypothetical protein
MLICGLRNVPAPESRHRWTETVSSPMFCLFPVSVSMGEAGGDCRETSHGTGSAQVRSRKPHGGAMSLDSLRLTGSGAPDPSSKSGIGIAQGQFPSCEAMRARLVTASI